MGWTEEKDKVLCARFADGASAAAIAREMGGGLTRNAVIGRLHRIGLRRGNPQMSRLKKAMPPAIRNATVATKAKPFLYKEPAKKAAEPEPLGPLHDFPAVGLCRWIHGAVPGPDWHCCAAPVREVGDPYCAFHRSASHTPRKTEEAIAEQHHRTATSHAGKVFA